MVKSSHARESNDLSAIRGPGIGGSPRWRIGERGVDALGVVVLEVLLQEASEVIFAEHHHVIEKLSSNATDEALRCPVLPGTSEGGALRRGAAAGSPRTHAAVE